MAFKFNNGNGAIICDKCRIIVKAPAQVEDSVPGKDDCGQHVVPKTNLSRAFALAKFIDPLAGGLVVNSILEQLDEKDQQVADVIANIRQVYARNKHAIEWMNEFEDLLEERRNR